MENRPGPSMGLSKPCLTQVPCATKALFFSHLGGCTLKDDSSGAQSTSPIRLHPHLAPALLTTNLSYPGCGKTYTMLGTDHEPGIYVRTLNDLFRAIEETSNDMEYEVSMSYLEVSPHQAWIGGM